MENWCQVNQIILTTARFQGSFRDRSVNTRKFSFAFCGLPHVINFWKTNIFLLAGRNSLTLWTLSKLSRIGNFCQIIIHLPYISFYHWCRFLLFLSIPFFFRAFFLFKCKFNVLQSINNFIHVSWLLANQLALQRAYWLRTLHT